MYEETFRFYSGNAIEDAFDMRMTGDFSGNCVELSEERLGGSAAAADKARTMAMERGAEVSVMDDTFAWCLVYDKHGNEIDDYSDPNT